MPRKGRQYQASIYLSAETLTRLQRLAKRTRIPQAAYLREAVEDLLVKYEVRQNPPSKVRSKP